MTVEEYIQKNVEPYAREEIKDDLIIFLRSEDVRY